MHPHFLAGVVFAWVVAYVGLGAFFALVARVAPRREPHWIVFALLSMALGLVSFGVALSYVYWDDISWFEPVLKIAFAGAVATLPFFLHLAALLAEIPKRWRLLGPWYTIAAALVAADLAGMTHRFDATKARPASFLGTPAIFFVAPLAPVGFAVAAFVFVSIAGTVALFALAWWRGRRETVPALIGGVLAGYASVHDGAMIVGVGGDVWLAPHAFVAFAAGVAFTFALRYARLSRALGERTIELERANADLVETQRELVHKEQLAAVGELAAVVAHEVRNPLAIVSNAVGTLRRSDVSPDDREELLGMLAAETSRLAQLVTDLLRYTKPIDVSKRHVDLVELAETAVAPLALPAGVRVRVIPGSPVAPPKIWGDPTLLRQVFANLVENASQSFDGGGTVELRVVRDEIAGRAAARVEVVDSGRGMSAEVMARARQPFFTTRPAGTGLGLAIVERIVRVHGGELALASRIGEGTTVSFAIPVGAAPEPREPIAEAEA